MKIGFLLPSHYAIGSPTNGVLAQVRYQRDAVRRAGHEVIELNPWTPHKVAELDVIHYFLGGFALEGISATIPSRSCLLVWASMIDSNISFKRYRMAARLGELHPKLKTVPGVLRDQARTSDLVIVRSTHERDRIVKGLEIEPEKVEIILNGVNPPVPADPELARRELNLPDRFALHVSMYDDPRKNAIRMIEAIGPTGKPLILAGFLNEGRELERVRNAAKKYPNVRLMGYVRWELLQSLYAACDVFVLPSIHEGTGLVAVEAAAHGAKVVITQHGGPPDYFKDMAEYVNPESIDSICDGFLRAWSRRKDGRLMKHVTENLTWDQSAAAMLAAYEKHAQRRKNRAR